MGTPITSRASCDAKKGGKNFAIKKVVNTERNTAQKEIKILKQVDHDHIIKYFDHFMEKNILCIVLEYADLGTMEKAIKNKAVRVEEWNIWRCIAQLSDALAYLHSRSPQILHHDLKPDNILGVTVWSRSENGHRMIGCKPLRLEPLHVSQAAYIIMMIIRISSWYLPKTSFSDVKC